MSKKKRTYADWNEAMMAGKRPKSRGLANEAVAGENIQQPKQGVRVEVGDLKPNGFNLNPESRLIGKRLDFEGNRG